jgi:hypothetical protein
MADTSQSARQMWVTWRTENTKLPESVDASVFEFRAFEFSWLIPAFRAFVAESACRETTKHRPRKRENTKLPKGWTHQILSFELSRFRG